MSYIELMGAFARRQFKGIEVVRIVDDARGFAPHFHDEFVLSVNVQGREKIKLDRRSFDATAREVTLYNPAQIQSSRVVSEPWQFASMYVDTAILPVLFDASPDTVFDRHLFNVPYLSGQMLRAIELALNHETPEGVAHEALVRTLDDLLQFAGSHKLCEANHIPASIGRIAERLREESVLPSLMDLAQEAGLTPVQLVRAFSKAYGLPPLAWAWNQRVSEARRRIAQGDRMAAVAAELGFSDQAHLTRRFRDLFGVPPGRWHKG